MAAPTLKPNPSRAIDLMRVSGDRQDVARQRTDLKKNKEKFGLAQIRTLELMGVSGTAVLNNEQIQQILRDMSDPTVDGISISSLDRLFRPKRYSDWSILDYFADNKKVIWSKREGMIEPWTDEGYEICMSAGGRAGAEWREIIRRTNDGRAEKRAEGKLDHGAACYAYRYLGKDHAERPQTLEPNGEMSNVKGVTQAEVVLVRVFEARLCMSTYEVVRQLNVGGFLTASGKPWSRFTLLRMLHNPTYKGEHTRCGQIFPCPAIVPAELWQRVQDKIAQETGAAKTGRPATKRPSLLRKFLWCGRPGCNNHRMYAKTSSAKGGNGLCYGCGHITMAPYKRLCLAPSVQCAKLDDIAFHAIWKRLIDPALLLADGEAYYASLGGNDKVAELQREIAFLKDRVKTTERMMKDRIVTNYEQSRAEIQADQSRIREVEVELRAAGRVVSLPPLAAAKAALAEFIDADEPKDYEDRRPVLEGLHDLKMTYFDGELMITGKVPVAVADDSTGSGKNKCDRRLIPCHTSFVDIPFVIRERVA